MTARYTLYDISRLSKRFAPDAGVPRGTKPSYNILPVQSSTIIVHSNNKLTIDSAMWGFVQPNAHDTHAVFRYKSYATKSEGIFSKPSLEQLIRRSRCLVPVNGFYIIARDNQAYYAHRPDHSLFALGGIQSTWTNPSGAHIVTFSIITTTANSDIEHLSDRMPVVIHPDDETRWINPVVDDMNTLYDIMRPCPPGVLVIQRVDNAQLTPKAQGLKLIQPIL